MMRKSPVSSRAQTSPGLLPIFSTKKYTPTFIGISIDANINCVRYGFSPNPLILRVIP